MLVQRLARAYGTRATAILSSELGRAVAGNLHEAELQYLYQHEWARCSEDVLWRRSKLGLHLSEPQREAVQDWCRLNWPD
jgi:glycerol-3-phosphate dehydrogenase